MPRECLSPWDPLEKEEEVDARGDQQEESAIYII